MAGTRREGAAPGATVQHDDSDDPVDRIYDALDAGEPERALSEAAAAIVVEREDPVLHLLAGLALLELDRPGEAAEALGASLELDPDDPDTRANLALALFRTVRVDQAATEARGALERDDANPDAHHALGLALELRGELEQADHHLDRAVELDPERFPPPRRLSPADFDARLSEAIGRLPETFRRHLDRIVVALDEVPRRELLEADTPPLDPELLGLFEGLTHAEEHSVEGTPELPPRIYLFKRNLERFASSDDDLAEQIEITLRHELGHYLGLDEDELADSGYA